MVLFRLKHDHDTAVIATFFSDFPTFLIMSHDNIISTFNRKMKKTKK